MAKALIGYVGGPTTDQLRETARLHQRISDLEVRSAAPEDRERRSPEDPRRARRPRHGRQPARTARALIQTRLHHECDARCTRHRRHPREHRRRPLGWLQAPAAPPPKRHSAEELSVYLKSLTLRGFKSFASSTTLQFEPGITCVVGPNGSGKSNVVDALSWVMGEQGAKSLRGGKMEDVIFAGTAGRPPLGRAEVVLTIDNTDGALPIEYSEVTISRTMFRNGGSEYAINGTPCRLLDVQELLSDSGIGREMHVIVGQGQLDSVLRATPEERRGFIEEAAGVLKHRKRKEKALRKLDATQGNLTRLQDVLTELRRQLKPLGRQAEVARRAAVIQADARDARARLLADDVVAARSVIDEELADETALKEQRRRSSRRSPRHATPRPSSRTTCAPTRRGSPPPRRPGTACPGCANDCAAPPGWPPSAYGWPPSRPTTSSGSAAIPRSSRPRPDASGSSSSGWPRQWPRRPPGSSRPSPSATRPRPPTPPRNDGSPACCAPRPTSVRVWPGCTARSTPSRAGRPPPATRSAASPPPATRPSDARSEAHHAFTVQENEIAGLNAGESGLDAELEAAEAALGAIDDRLARLRPRHPRRRATSGRAVGPQGGARAGPGPQGRCRRAAGRHRRDQRTARLGRRADERAGRLRDRHRGGARVGRRRGRRRPSRQRRLGHAEAQVRGPRPRRHAARLRRSAGRASTTPPGRACPTSPPTRSTSSTDPASLQRCPAAAAVQGRRRRRPRARQAPRRPGVRRHGGHARRRRPGLALRGRWLGVHVQPDRGQGRDRAGRDRPRRRRPRGRVAALRAAGGRVRARRGAGAGRRRTRPAARVRRRDGRRRRAARPPRLHGPRRPR